MHVDVPTHGDGCEAVVGLKQNEKKIVQTVKARSLVAVAAAFCWSVCLANFFGGKSLITRHANSGTIQEDLAGATLRVQHTAVLCTSSSSFSFPDKTTNHTNIPLCPIQSRCCLCCVSFPLVSAFLPSLSRSVCPIIPIVFACSLKNSSFVFYSRTASMYAFPCHHH